MIYHPSFEKSMEWLCFIQLLLPFILIVYIDVSQRSASAKPIKALAIINLI